MTTRVQQWLRQIEDFFGPVYAALVERAARAERALAVGGAELDVMDVTAVAGHLVELYELAGLRDAIVVALQATGVISDPASLPTVSRDHVQQLLTRWQADNPIS